MFPNLNKIGNRKSKAKEKESLLSKEFELPQKQPALETAIRRESKLESDKQILKEERHALIVDVNSLKLKICNSEVMAAELLKEMEFVEGLRKQLASEIKTKK